MAEEKSCRICLSSEHPDSLIRPCLCDGGMRYVHRNCLNVWRLQNIGSAYYRCEICRYQYNFHRIWWAKILESKLISGFLALLLFILSIVFFGYCSANTVNTVWYWFHHDEYHTPHRLQVLFYGLLTIGLPGLIILLKDLFSENRNIRLPEPPIFHAPRVYYIGPQYVREERREEREKREEKRENSDKHKVASYESPSLFIWVPIIIGAGKSVYIVYTYINRKSREYCSRLQDLIENVN